MADDRRDAPHDLGGISTSWRQVHDTAKFVATYTPAVRKYLLAVLRDEHDADEVLQDLLVRVTERGFEHADPTRGRFRDYLRAIVRNAARTHLRKKSARPGNPDVLDDLPAADPDPADAGWRDEWRRCVLESALRALARHQQASPGNLYHTAVRLTIDHPGEDSVRLAARAAAACGRPVQPEAFRQHLSRA